MYVTIMNAFVMLLLLITDDFVQTLASFKDPQSFLVKT